MSDLDLYLFSEGRHERPWNVLGAHPSADGTSFAVWAPNAREVRVVGDFADWTSGVALDRLGPSGVWAGDVQGAHAGQRYKFKVHGADGVWREKADPMATATEAPPLNASVIYESRYEWGDDDWMASRRGDHHARPMSVYEVHVGSWRPGLSYVELADQLVEHVCRLGFTHVEFLPVMEHPYGGSWGYQVTGYFAPSARWGTPDDFRYVVDRLHRAGVGVIVDWVPAHFPRDEWALGRFDGTALYEHPDPQRGEHPDWGTLVFDYGRPQVRNFLIGNAAFWAAEFHVDGLRVDAVASMLYLDYSRGPGQWTPNIHGGNTNLEAVSFLQELTSTIYRDHPGVVMIAEESTAWPGVSRPVDWGGLGFGLKWNMGWMHDTLAYVGQEPVFRRFHHDTLTLPTCYAFDEQFLLPISHDEVVHGKRSLTAKMPGDRWQRLAGLRGLLAYMWAFPGKQLLFMGAELADEAEWSEHHGLNWALAADPAVGGVQQLLADLNQHYRADPALWSQDAVPAGFQWISHDDRDSNLLAFTRRAPDGQTLVCVTNFSGTPHRNYPLHLPQDGQWDEIINTDAATYGGTGEGNHGTLTTHHHTTTLTIGPYATIWLQPTT